ncbi:FadR/GntR family transcriptional regulator [Primorskyibacter sp. S187A]|uniref:FadR/GntR family transcriptional regulator n=1 Tax=Primorskyibacter sp. S187A TaxID=3415130 RepID=UPI003C7C3B78
MGLLTQAKPPLDKTSPGSTREVADQIAALDVDEFKDTLELRATLDYMAVKMAADQRSDADCDKLRVCAVSIEAVCGVVDIEAAIASEVALYAAIYSATQNDMLCQLADGFGERIQENIRQNRLRLNGSEVTRRILRDQQGDIIDAILRKDGVAAGDALLLHLAFIREALVELEAVELRLAQIQKNLDNAKLCMDPEGAPS